MIDVSHLHVLTMLAGPKLSQGPTFRSSLWVDKVYRGIPMSTHVHTVTVTNRILPGANIAPALSTLSLSKHRVVFEGDPKKNSDLLFTFPRLLEAKLVHELRRPL